MKPDERRRAERIPVMLVTDVVGQGEPVRVTLCDISLTGVRFLAHHQFAPDSVVHLNIEYSPLDFALRGLIVWSRPQGEQVMYGAEFVNVPDYLQVMLRDHLKTLRASVGADSP